MIVHDVLNHLEQPGQNIAIVDIDDVHRDCASVFEFINECRRWEPEREFGAEFIRPYDHDDGEGTKIVLMANPARIAEHNVLDTRVYIVPDTSELKRSLIKYRIQT